MSNTPCDTCNGTMYDCKTCEWYNRSEWPTGFSPCDGCHHTIYDCKDCEYNRSERSEPSHFKPWR